MKDIMGKCPSPYSPIEPWWIASQNQSNPEEKPMETVTLVTHPTDGVKITWEIPYTVDENEGSLETLCPRPVCAVWIPRLAHYYPIYGIQDGSMLSLLILDKYKPDEVECHMQVRKSMGLG